MGKILLALGVLGLVAIVLFWLGGWPLLLIGTVAFFAWIWTLFKEAQAEQNAKVKSEPLKGANHVAPPAKLPDKNPAYVPTPDQLAQIEQARQSSLATLKAKEQGIKPPVKGANTPPAAVRSKSAGKPTVKDIEPIDLPDRVEINYLKADGGLDRRVVNVNQVDRFGDKFTGFCERAGAVRTFKVSGIQGYVTRLETGELVDYRAWFKALKGKTTPSPKPAPRQRKSAVALLGFHYSKYEALAEQVEAAGWHARHALSDSVDYVVFGPNAGERQRKDADKRAIPELTEGQLKKML